MTSIPKNLITVKFNGSNLKAWAPQVQNAADLLGIGYIFDSGEIDYSDLDKRIDAAKALAVIVTSITPAMNEWVHTLKKRPWDPNGTIPQGVSTATSIYPPVGATSISAHIPNPVTEQSSCVN